MRKFFHISFLQGFYFFFAGLWPLVHMKSFEMITGPKTDIWLVRTVGVLVTVIGGVLILFGFRRKVFLEIRVLAMGSALGLAGIEIFHVLAGQISKIYLLDTLMEVIFVILWTLSKDLEETLND